MLLYFSADGVRHVGTYYVEVFVARSFSVRVVMANAVEDVRVHLFLDFSGLIVGEEL
jgi:hypothetical protein